MNQTLSDEKLFEVFYLKQKPLLAPSFDVVLINFLGGGFFYPNPHTHDRIVYASGLEKTNILGF